jgi:AhpD family alkylhydroperoxidase
MQGFGALQGALRRSSLTALEREVVGITVSSHNRSGYSLAAHSTFAASAGADEETLDALRGARDVPDPRLLALQRFTRAVLAAQGHVGDAELTAFTDAGFSHEQVLEAIAQIAYTTLANLAANVTSTPIDQAFQPQAEMIAAA